MTYNINDKMVIYPNERGWDLIRLIIAHAYEISDEEAANVVERRRTEFDGYGEQMWVIINLLYPLFDHGTTYLVTTKIILFENKFDN